MLLINCLPNETFPHLNTPTPIAASKRHFSVMSWVLGWNTKQVCWRLGRWLITSWSVVGTLFLWLFFLTPKAPRWADLWQLLKWLNRTRRKALKIKQKVTETLEHEKGGVRKTFKRMEITRADKMSRCGINRNLVAWGKVTVHVKTEKSKLLRKFCVKFFYGRDHSQNKFEHSFDATTRRFSIIQILFSLLRLYNPALLNVSVRRSI